MHGRTARAGHNRAAKPLRHKRSARARRPVTCRAEPTTPSDGDERSQQPQQPQERPQQQQQQQQQQPARSQNSTWPPGAALPWREGLAGDTAKPPHERPYEDQKMLLSAAQREVMDLVRAQAGHRVAADCHDSGAALGLNGTAYRNVMHLQRGVHAFLLKVHTPRRNPCNFCTCPIPPAGCGASAACAAMCAKPQLLR
jgi:hypothetical protein